MPNFVKIASIVAEISRFLIFQDGGGRHLGFSKFKFFRGSNSITVPSFVEIA